MAAAMWMMYSTNIVRDPMLSRGTQVNVVQEHMSDDEHSEGSEEDTSEGEQPRVKPPRVHTCWVREWISMREDAVPNTHYDLQEQLVLMEDTKEFRSMLRMDYRSFMVLLETITPMIKRKWTKLRKPIPPGRRLSVALQFFATGQDYGCLSRANRIGRKTAGRIIKHVSEAIIQLMQDDYLTTPTEEEKWDEIASVYEKRWQHPHCLGAVDGKHVRICPPPKTGAHYWNYKGFYSIVLLGVVDANYEFIYVNIGAEGRAGDSGIYERSSFFRALSNGTLQIPGEKTLPRSKAKAKAPYVLVGDDAFKLTTNLMKPYAHRDLEDDEIIYNYRLSRARRCSENAFGVLVNRFRVFLTPMQIKVETVKKVVHACCILHNFLRRRIGHGFTHLTAGEKDISRRIRDANGSENVTGLEPTFGRNSTEHSKDVRNIYRTYFMSNAGRVPWQEAKALYK